MSTFLLLLQKTVKRTVWRHYHVDSRRNYHFNYVLNLRLIKIERYYIHHISKQKLTILDHFSKHHSLPYRNLHQTLDPFSQGIYMWQHRLVGQRDFFWPIQGLKEPFDVLQHILIFPSRRKRILSIDYNSQLRHHGRITHAIEVLVKLLYVNGDILLRVLRSNHSSWYAKPIEDFCRRLTLNQQTQVIVNVYNKKDDFTHSGVDRVIRIVFVFKQLLLKPISRHRHFNLNLMALCTYEEPMKVLSTFLRLYNTIKPNNFWPRFFHRPKILCHHHYIVRNQKVRLSNSQTISSSHNVQSIFSQCSVNRLTVLRHSLFL